MGKRNAWIRILCLLLVGGLLGAMLPGGLPQAVAAGSRKVNISIAEVNHCEIYYCEGGELVPIKEGEVINKTTTGNYGILFFAAPHNGYALSAMTATSSQGDYYTISNGEPNGAGSEFYTYGNGKNVTNLKRVGYSEAQIEQILTQAIAVGCDGALLFSRSASDTGPINSNLMFCAEKLPTLEKHIKSVTPKNGGQDKTYTEGMSVGFGDTINYSLDVTFYPLENKQFAVKYWDMEVLDEKTGNGANNPVRITVPDASKLQNMTGVYVVSEDVHYTIVQEDVKQGTVLNQAQLSYQYQSLRSKGLLATTSDAQASIIVHASINYQYQSGTAGMQLPPELEVLTPTDYTYYDENTTVTVQPHVQSPFWDEANGGYWTLQNNGVWSSSAGDIAADGTFPMPSTPVALMATWVFTKAPAIGVEKDGSIQNAPADGKEGDTVSYTAHYTLSVQNTGGEPLNQFTICDDTLPPNVADITAEIGGMLVTLENPSYDTQTRTLTFTLPQELQLDETLVLSYFGNRTGTVGYKTELTDQSQAEVVAVGTQTKVSAQDDATLDIQVTLKNVIILTPADIVIYAGGDEKGNNVAPGTNLPEPGFFVTLPLAAENELRAATGDTEQVDLSCYLTFTDENKNIWGLEPFCGEEYSKSDGHFLYRLVPVQVQNGQKKIEMQFYDEELGTQIRQSEFDITNALQREYAMSIYPGEIPAVEPVAVLKAAGQEIGRYGIDVSSGKLMIRGTTGLLDTEPVADSMPETQPEQISVYAFSDDTEYFINQSELKVQSKNVALLIDHIVDSVYDQALQTLASDVISQIEVSAQKVLRYEFRYLDLVDTSMGNTWVTASKPLKVVWPYPDGTDHDDDFTIIHYKGMDRDYNLEDIAQLKRGEDYVLEVYTTDQMNQYESSSDVTYHELTRTDSGLCFVADGFSPYVLIWQGAPESNSSGGTTVKPEKPEIQPEPAPDGLNTTDHYAYLIGRGNNGVQPLEAITRAEIATIWFRLLTDETRAVHWSTADCYPDVAAGTWYHNIIATITQMDVMYGDTDGLFRPKDEITRVEFVASAVRFFASPEPDGEMQFTDVPDDAWYAEAVRGGAALGLIEGDGNGTFRPEDTITRAETVAIINRMLRRKPHGGKLLEQAVQWVDNPKDAWYYEDMLEATVGHDYEWLGKGENRAERWTALQAVRDWTTLEKYGPQGT